MTSRQKRNRMAQGEKFIFGVLTDITLLKEREEALEMAWKNAKSAELAKSQFLANMSHEVRTPMNGIMGMADLLERCELPPRQKDFVGVIQRSGDALLTILNDILDFSKIEAGQLLIDPAPFVMRDCIEDVMALLAPKVNETGIDMLLRIQPGLPRAFVGDVGRIRQILTNIIGNAVKFTPEGHVYINVSGELGAEGQARLTFSVEDTGIGIAEDKLESIFDKFNQADISTTREFGGTGLGLNIARDLVRLMGGDINLESCEDRGSRFFFTLELPPHDDLETPRDRAVSLSGLKVLVIDDNPINRQILTEQLTHWRCKSAAVGSADKAMNVLKRAAQKNISFDVIITDFQMPEKNGGEFVSMLKGDSACQDIPVIMLSSVDKTELKNQMSSLGVERFLTKPTRASVLKMAISATQKKARRPRRSIPHTPASVQLPVSGQTAPKISETTSSKATPAEITPSEIMLSEALPSKGPNPERHIDVLIAEDNEVNQFYMRYVMEEMGLSHKLVGNGKIAVDKWKLLCPKIILMDISMPEMNGHEATAAIRKAEAETGRPRTPIIAVTAHSLKGDMEHCFENDMDGYLSKPIAIEKLANCLREWKVIAPKASAKSA